YEISPGAKHGFDPNLVTRLGFPLRRDVKLKPKGVNFYPPN
ncbi:hypothetical protein RRG08_065097, partial [Elysia crispata]